jgi:hypothetical protein
LGPFVQIVLLLLGWSFGMVAAVLLSFMVVQMVVSV